MTMTTSIHLETRLVGLFSFFFGAYLASVSHPGLLADISKSKRRAALPSSARAKGRRNSVKRDFFTDARD
jgi:hypothetical protein